MTGVIVGCMVFAAVVLTIIVICRCYVCRETEKDKVYIDEVCNLLVYKLNAVDYICNSYLLYSHQLLKHLIEVSTTHQLL